MTTGILKIAPAAFLALSLLGSPALAQSNMDNHGTSNDVQEEISDAFAAIQEYSADRRDAALENIDSALSTLDAEIERRAEALRDGWSEMSEDAQQVARENLNELREARLALAERVGALRDTGGEYWDDMMDGLEEAYEDVADALSS